MGSAKNCHAAQLPANPGAATAPDAPASPHMRHDKAHRTGRIQDMFSRGATRRKEPGSSDKRIRSRLRVTCPYSLDAKFAPANDIRVAHFANLVVNGTYWIESYINDIQGIDVEDGKVESLAEGAAIDDSVVPQLLEVLG